MERYTIVGERHIKDMSTVQIDTRGCHVDGCGLVIVWIRPIRVNAGRAYTGTGTFGPDIELHGHAWAHRRETQKLVGIRGNGVPGALNSEGKPGFD